MDATSQISREARDAIIDNVQTGLGGIDIDMNRQREQPNAHANSVYNTNEEIKKMNIQELRTYAKYFHNGWQDLLLHEEGGVGWVCVNG